MQGFSFCFRVIATIALKKKKEKDKEGKEKGRKWPL